MTLSSPLTVVALMNGMIGGVILVLPVTSFQAGYLFTMIAILISGAFSFYSCYLSIKHLGDQKDMNYSMQAHFGSKIAKIVYDVVVWLGLLFGSMFYYALICIQWQSLTGKDSIAIPSINAAAIFLLIFLLKYFDFGASLMAYGIVSIISYMIFLIWVIASSPKGNADWVPVGTNLYSFGATMSLAYAIQAFFIPVLMKNPLKSKHVFLTLMAYVIGACAYAFICVIGSVGIMNRTALAKDPQTIEDYFKIGNVQVRIIESIYLVHLYSCLPEFVLISKKRLFNIFKIQQTKKGQIPIRQIIYSLVFLGICLFIRLLDVQIDTIIAINGAIIGFFNIYFFPVVLHIKCLYFSKNKRPLDENLINVKRSIVDNQKTIQMEEINQGEHRVNQHEQRSSNRNHSVELRDPLFHDELASVSSHQSGYEKNINLPKKSSSMNNRRVQNQQSVQKQPQIRNYFLCNCEKPSTPLTKILQLVVLLAMVALGAAIMVNGLISVT